MSYNINFNTSFENNEEKKDDVVLSNKERQAFKNEFEKTLDDFNQINELIEEHLDIEGIKETDAKTANEDPDTLEMKQSYADPAKIQRERMQRIGLLKSDPTGRQLKASGEDI